MNWEFFGVMFTLAGSGAFFVLAKALADRISQGGRKAELQAGRHMDPLAEDRLLASLSNVEERIANLEERFEFNERLLQGRTESSASPVGEKTEE